MKNHTAILIEAIYRGQVRKVEQAISAGANVNYHDEDGITPLMCAILEEKPSPKIIKLLITNGAEVNFNDNREKWTALHFAARAGHVEIANILLGAGALIEARDVFGNTPLMRAISAFKNREQIIRFLLKHGADRNAINESGVSPMSLADTMGDRILIDLFMAR
jgi:ankyrin repeat protein